MIGFLRGSSLDQPAFRVTTLHEGLAETGHSEGRNVAIEYRWAENQYDRLPTLAAQIVRRRVPVMAAVGGDLSVLGRQGGNRHAHMASST